jgi:hypothetical protein
MRLWIGILRAMAGVMLRFASLLLIFFAALVTSVSANALPAGERPSSASSR